MNRGNIYTFTLSSVSPETVRSLLASLPEKYRVTQYGTPIPAYNGQETGVARISFFLLTSEQANALRKWFYRRTRYKTGRGSFARLVMDMPKAAPAPAPTEPTVAVAA